MVGLMIGGQKKGNILLCFIMVLWKHFSGFCCKIKIVKIGWNWKKLAIYYSWVWWVFWVWHDLEGQKVIKLVLPLPDQTFCTLYYTLFEWSRGRMRRWEAPLFVVLDLQQSYAYLYITLYHIYGYTHQLYFSNLNMMIDQLHSGFLLPAVPSAVPSAVPVSLKFLQYKHRYKTLIKSLISMAQGTLIRAFVLRHVVNHPEILWLHNISHVSEMMNIKAVQPGVGEGRVSSIALSL